MAQNKTFVSGNFVFLNFFDVIRITSKRYFLRFDMEFTSKLSLTEDMKQYCMLS